MNLKKKIEILRKRLPKIRLPRKGLFLLSKKNLKFLLAALVILGIAYFTKSFFIAALVNGKPISRLTLIRDLEKQGGSQALDNIITKELISQEAKKKGVTVTDTEIQTDLDQIKTTVEGQGTTLEAALAYQGQTLDDLKENLYIKKTIEKILGDEVQVSDDEISKYYDDNKTVFGTKKLEEVKDQIKDQLFQQKLGTKFTEWISQVKNNAKVKYFVNF